MCNAKAEKTYPGQVEKRQRRGYPTLRWRHNARRQIDASAAAHAAMIRQKKYPNPGYAQTGSLLSGGGGGGGGACHVGLRTDIIERKDQQTQKCQIQSHPRDGPRDAPGQGYRQPNNQRQTKNTRRQRQEFHAKNGLLARKNGLRRKEDWTRVRIKTQLATERAAIASLIFCLVRIGNLGETGAVSARWHGSIRRVQWAVFFLRLYIVRFVPGNARDLTTSKWTRHACSKVFLVQV